MPWWHTELRSLAHSLFCSALFCSVLLSGVCCEHQDDSEQTLYDGLVIVFGEPFCLRWLLPIPGGALVRKEGTVDVTPRGDDDEDEVAGSTRPKAD
jgi:hypothetical protein